MIRYKQSLTKLIRVTSDYLTDPYSSSNPKVLLYPQLTRLMMNIQHYLMCEQNSTRPGKWSPTADARTASSTWGQYMNTSFCIETRQSFKHNISHSISIWLLPYHVYFLLLTLNYLLWILKAMRCTKTFTWSHYEPANFWSALYKQAWSQLLKTNRNNQSHQWNNMFSSS